MALMLGATAFSAGCGDDTDGGTGGGTTASSSSTTTSSATTGTGGEGGEGGGGDGGGGGEGVECVTCSAPLLDDADPNDLCESSLPKYVALTDCICEACGAADGDPCFNECSPEGAEQSDECTACGSMVATEADGACIEQGTVCLQDTGE
ncbi:hypothetical protein [Sorangium sp. So ce406]|uniref:hypothetical protein n=1 Tax=Sorangium sp. So ce406 TaxID=3133311 RepID=UPI003F5B1F40